MTRFTEYGFVSTVKKPIDIQELAETVKRVLENVE
jgi:DNA-binding NtrC family response regulator